MLESRVVVLAVYGFTGILVLLLFLKILAVYRAIQWISSENAVKFRSARYKKEDDLSEGQLAELYLDSQADFVPFGAMDHKLTLAEGKYLKLSARTNRSSSPGQVNSKVTENGPPATKRKASYFLAFWLIRFYRLCIFRVTKLSLIACLSSAVIAFLFDFSRTIPACLFYVPIFMSSIMVVFWGVECAIGYASFGDYLSVFRNQSPLKSCRATRVMSAIRHLGLLIRLNLTQGMLLIYCTCCYNENAFAGIRPTSLGHSVFSRELTTILNSLYFCLTTFTTVGYGDIHAESVSGKIACLVLQSMSAILFLVVFAIVIGIVINREDHDV